MGEALLPSPSFQLLSLSPPNTSPIALEKRTSGFCDCHAGMLWGQQRKNCFSDAYGDAHTSPFSAPLHSLEQKTASAAHTQHKESPVPTQRMLGFSSSSVKPTSRKSKEC